MIRRGARGERGWGRRPRPAAPPTPLVPPDEGVLSDHPFRGRVRRPGGRGSVAAVERGARAFDPRYRLAAMQKGMVGWALFNAYFALLLTHVSTGKLTGVGQFGIVVDYTLMASCLLQLAVGSLLLRLPIRLPVAGVLFALFMTWGSATTLFANGDLGRSLYGPLEYFVIWGFYPLFIYVAVDQGVYLSPGIRKLIVVPWLLSLALSGFVGFAQMGGSEYARSLSPSGFFGTIFRPTGLTDYTFMLGMQGVVGMAILGARLKKRDLSLWEWAGVGFFALVTLSAQYRSLYYTGLLLTGAILLAIQFRRDRAKGITMSLLGIGAILLPILAFPQKFEYGLRGTEGDAALQARYDSWQQLGPILHDRPLTGIGADANLMISSNLANIDRYAGTIIDNFYRMVLICYGYMGGLLMVLVIAALVVGLFMRYDSTRAPEVKVYTLAGIIVMAATLGVSLTGNSFVYRQVGYQVAVLLALGGASWQERRLVDPVSPLIAWIRVLARTPLKVLFPNLGRVR